MRRVALLAVVLAGCGGEGPSVPASPATSVGGSLEFSGTALLRWNEFNATFPWPSSQPWSQGAPSGSPHHHAVDVFAKAGAPVTIRGKFHYGDFRVDLAGETVGLWLHEVDGDGWTYVADAVTNGDGRADFTVDLGPGTYYARIVVYGDLTVSDSLVRILDGTTPAVLFDIDGTLTTSDMEMVEQVLGDLLDLNYVPRMYPDANKVAAQFAKDGYEIVYLTARPNWLTRASRQWLAKKGFPLGIVLTYPDWWSVFGEALSDFKRDTILALEDAGASFAYAFGNASTDQTAYEEAGIETIYMVGQNLAAYADLYGTVVSAPVEPYRVAWIVIDGLRPDALRYYLEILADDSSALKQVFGTCVDVKHCATTAPSITFSGHASIATGRNPASHGVPGNEYFDRKTETPIAYSAGSTVEVDQVVAVYQNEGMANRALQVQTVYEQMSASGRYGIAASHMYFRGSEYLYPSYLQLLYFLIDSRQYDRMVTDAVLERLDHPDRPDLLTVYWPGLDHEAHGEGRCGQIELMPLDYTNLQLEYLKNVIDPELQRVKDKLEALGILGETVFVLCSDHGHRDVVKDDAHAVDIDPFGLDDEIEQVLEDSPYDDCYDKIIWEGDYDCHAASNGPVLHVTLRNRETVKWQDSPRWVEDVQPVLGSIQQHRWKGQLVGAVEEILVRTAKDQPYLVARPTRVKVTVESIEAPANATIKVRLNGKTIGASAEIDLLTTQDLQVKATGIIDGWWIFDTYLGSASVTFDTKASLAPTAVLDAGSFQVHLKFELVTLPTYAHPELPGWGNLCPLTVMSPEYVDGPERIAALAHPDRSGDILLFASFRQGYYFGGKNAANHGSLYPEDSYHCFFVGGAPVVQGQVVEGGSVVDVAATVCHILGIDLRGKEGVSKVDAGSLPFLGP